MTISAIVAADKNGCIGKDKTIPWYLPADLKYFKKTTMGHHLIMGRVCFEDIGKPLPGRTTIIVTRNKKYKARGCKIAHSIEQALEIAQKAGDKEPMICGGGQIYLLALPFIEKVYLTRVNLKVKNGDVFFPKLDKSGWKTTSKKSGKTDKKNEYEHTYYVYERKF